ESGLMSNERLYIYLSGEGSLKKLKILNMNDSISLTKTGSFIGVENLEELVLTRCENLKELDSCLKNS
nr:TMV resistance protein N [Tanacetum cinerariifolium]